MIFNALFGETSFQQFGNPTKTAANRTQNRKKPTKQLCIKIDNVVVCWNKRKLLLIKRTIFSYLYVYRIEII